MKTPFDLIEAADRELYLNKAEKKKAVGAD
jgi:hypothetical protein